jgi:hypothetical protein
MFMSIEPTYTVVAIPLNRPGIVDFLLPPRPRAAPRGAPVSVVGQRPSLAAQAKWAATLRRRSSPTVADLLAIDDPHAHLVATATDRLVPIQFLREAGFLTRNLGGWAPVYFGIVGAPHPWPADPLLDEAEILADYGATIRYFGADPAQAAARLEAEMGMGAAAVAEAIIRLYAERPPLSGLDHTAVADYVALIYAQIAEETCFGGDGAPPLPLPLLLDELMDWMVELELMRRRAALRGETAVVAEITAWLGAQREAAGLTLILKGEYIVGRHRRSTVLIAPELGVVVKQPGPEPFHEIELGAEEWEGEAENWPALRHNGALVTPRGRIRQVLEEGLIPQLHDVLRHPMDFYALLGITVEPFVAGPTTQELVLADPAALTPQLYETYVFHQQAAEALGVENGDWHAANFVVRQGDGQIVHIDWGAARPLRPEELTPEGERARLNQVKNIAFSFQDEALAARTVELHRDLLADEARLARLQEEARAAVDGR